MTDSILNRASAASLMPKWMIEAASKREEWVRRYAMLAGIPIADAGAVHDRIAGEAAAHRIDIPDRADTNLELRLQQEYRRVMKGEAPTPIGSDE